MLRRYPITCIQKINYMTLLYNHGYKYGFKINKFLKQWESIQKQMFLYKQTDNQVT